MAFGDPYATLEELKSYLQMDSDSRHDDELADALAAASAEIERCCNRQFNKGSSATARVYIPDHCGVVYVDDFYTTTGLIIKTDLAGDGTYESTWTSSDYELFPLNGIVDGQAGWPYDTIRSTGSLYFPINRTGRRATVEVTANWGWDEVPAPVKQACLILAAENFALKGAPLGVAGMGEFGYVRVRDNKMAARKLHKYTNRQVLVGT